MPDEPFVVGRQAEQQRFARFVVGDARVLNLYGPGGMGKSVVVRLLEDQARRNGLLVAKRDLAECGSPDVLLQDLRQQLGQHEGHDVDRAFEAFDDALREHLVLTEVLESSGGAGVFFDALGQVTDPMGVTKALASLGRSTADRVERRLRNRAAFDHYWRGADRLLAEAFASGVGRLSSGEGRVVFLLDTYEEAGPIDDWMGRTLVPSLPDQARVVLAGRNDVTRANFDWTELGEDLVLHALPELDLDEARAYLSHYGLTDSRQLESTVRVTGGYPLLLMLVRQLARSVGGWDYVGPLELRDRDELASRLLDRILSEERTADLRDVLERGAVAPWLDPGVIGALLRIDSADARRIYDQLAVHSFVERHPRGLRIHEKIRELLTARQEFTDPNGFTEAKQRLIDYYRERESAS